MNNKSVQFNHSSIVVHFADYRTDQVMTLLAIGLLAVATIAGAERATSFATNWELADSITPFVGNGVQARARDLSHHCTILIRNSSAWTYVSGALIAPNLVLTVLSPFARAREVRVYCGSNKLSLSRFIRAKAIYRHGKYDERLNLNNLGILELTAPIPDGLAKPIDLPPYESQNSNFDGQNIIVAGFGSSGM